MRSTIKKIIGKLLILCTLNITNIALIIFKDKFKFFTKSHDVIPRILRN